MNKLEDRAELFAKSVGSEIKAMLAAKKITQSEICRALNCQQSNLSKWLNGKPNIPIEVAYKICEYAGTSLADIVSIAIMRVKILIPNDDIDNIADDIATNMQDYTLASYKSPYRDEEKRGGEGR
ncbi:hypothetical protein CJI52_05925 [Bifidobacteriaceae bacterium WP022]|nr:hypothetical protein CJI52_05925 [Bifidobacteriaceae bacterium WP022]